MFDIWVGDINLTGLILLVSLAIVLPLQLFLCFKAQSRALRLTPVILALLAIMICAVFLFASVGFDGFVWLIFMIYEIFLLAACGLGWAVWAVVRLIQSGFSR